MGYRNRRVISILSIGFKDILRSGPIESGADIVLDPTHLCHVNMVFAARPFVATCVFFSQERGAWERRHSRPEFPSGAR